MHMYLAMCLLCSCIICIAVMYMCTVSPYARVYCTCKIMYLHVFWLEFMGVYTCELHSFAGCALNGVVKN